MFICESGFALVLESPCNVKNKNPGLESPGILLKVLESPGILNRKCKNGIS